MSLILIIDDSSYMRSRIRGALNAEGYDILEAENGYKGLQMIREHSPNCIILDLILPEVNGLKILKALYDQKTEIPVVVVTADIQESVREQCLELGAKAFINKPPKEDELRNTIKNILDLKKGATL
jgi:CheY-like chemotaxis protein